MNDLSYLNFSVTIDITPLRGKKTGIGNYVHYTLKYLLSEYNDLKINGISFGLHRFQKNSLEIVRKLQRNKYIPIPVRILYKWWEHFHYPGIDHFFHDNSIFHFTNYYLPPVQNKKTVLSIYDLTFLTNPQWVSPQIKNLFLPNIINSAQRASHIITCSEKSKKDIEILIGISSNKVSVSYPGFDNTIFQPLDKEEAQNYVEGHYRIDSPFILFVGTIEERKNITGLLNIYEKIHRQIPHKLVLIGKKGFHADDIFLYMQRLACAEKIVYLNYVQDHTELKWFYNSADLFVFPSFDEGFGIPPLEAMA
ncbi:MAG: glycosyltransferase family 4 protein, partial [Candidatus Hydrogenedens sp.]